LREGPYLTASGSDSINVLAPSSVALSSSSTQLAAGQSDTLVAQVTGSSSYYAPTGTVSFQVGSLVLGVSPVNGGVATFTASSQGVAPGTYPVTAVYSGDSNNGIGTSPPLSISVKDGTTTTLSVSPNPVSNGQTVKISSTVSRATTTGNPGGSVTFSTGGQTLAVVNLSGGTANFNFQLSGIASGTYPVVATYNGDGNDKGSVSPTVNVTVQ
jgi:hypothetical protein